MLVSVSPHSKLLAINRGNGMLLSDTEGFVTGKKDQGFFVRETRMLSHLQYLIDGKSPKPAAISPIEQHSSLAYYVLPAPRSEGAPPAKGQRQAVQEVKPNKPSKHALELQVRRRLERGFIGELMLTNYAHYRTRFRFEVALDADFADFRKARKGVHKQHGALERHWQDNVLLFDYRASHIFEHKGEQGEAHIHRQSQVKLLESDSPAQYSEGKLRFEIELAPHAQWHAKFDRPFTQWCSPSSGTGRATKHW